MFYRILLAIEGKVMEIYCPCCGKKVELDEDNECPECGCEIDPSKIVAAGTVFQDDDEDWFACDSAMR